MLADLHGALAAKEAERIVAEGGTATAVGRLGRAEEVAGRGTLVTQPSSELRDRRRFAGRW